MPTKPRIPKEKILEESLRLLIREGYDNVNIKTIARELKSSTQPISWHFKNMDGLREELSAYALNFANGIMEPKENEDNPLICVRDGYIDIAFDYPNLFTFLFLDGGSKYHLGSLKELGDDQGNELIAEELSNKLHVSVSKCKNYIEDLILFTHGILSFVVSGVINSTKEEVKKRISNVSDVLFENIIKGEK